MTLHIDEDMAKAIVERFTDRLESVNSIAESIGYNRSGVYSLLRRHGVVIKDYILIDKTCDVCGAAYKRKRSVERRTAGSFCSRECYYVWLNTGGHWTHKEPTIRSREGMKRARRVVSRYIDLKPDYVVHHINRNNHDNRATNLMVFACNGDHIKYHRGIDVKPIWDGSREV